MKRLRLLLIAVASAPMVIHAQSAPVAVAVTDAGAAVPPLHYQSAYDGYLRPDESAVSPDKLWTKANREVSGDAPQDPKAHARATTTSALPVQDKPAKDAPADPHAGHHMNKKGQ